jgi:hypothetical protein
VVTFRPERVMQALAPISDGATAPIAPQGDMSSNSSAGSWSSEDSTNRARRALFGT